MSYSHTLPTALTNVLPKPPARSTGFSRETYLYILEKAEREGISLREAHQEPGLPHYNTIYSVAIRDPEVGAALTRYRQSRAYLLDQEIEDAADLLTDLTRELSANDVRRLEVATKSKQWLAANRFPQVFGGHTEKSPTIAIQFNTNLPMNEEGASQNIFEITATVPTGPAQEEEEPQDE